MNAVQIIQLIVALAPVAEQLIPVLLELIKEVERMATTAPAELTALKASLGMHEAPKP